MINLYQRHTPYPWVGVVDSRKSFINSFLETFIMNNEKKIIFCNNYKTLSRFEKQAFINYYINQKKLSLSFLGESIYHILSSLASDGKLSSSYSADKIALDIENIFEDNNRKIDSSVCNFLGAYHYMKKNYLESIKYYEKSKQLNLDDFHDYKTLAHAYSKKGEYNKAIQAYKSSHYHPDFNIGLMYSKKGDTFNAINFYKKEIKINPNYEPAQYSIANQYFLEKNYQKALFHYRQAIKINPNDSNYYGLGVTYRAIGQYKKFINSLYQSLMINPFNLHGNNSPSPMGRNIVA